MKHPQQTPLGNAAFDILHLFGEEQINEIQNRLSRVTHLGFVTVNYRGEPLTDQTRFCSFCQQFRQDPHLSENCSVSDAMSSIQSAITGKPLIYQCPCGLMEIAIPIVINGSYLGGFLCGQARCQDPPASIMQMKPASDPEEFAAALAAFEHLKEDLPVFPYDKFTDIAELVSMIITMLCENKVQQLEKESGMREQISRIDFLQNQIFQLTRLYYQADYQNLMRHVPDMTKELYRFYAGDMTSLSAALTHLMESFLQTAICEEDAIARILRQYPLPSGSLLHQPVVTCWIMQILDCAVQRHAQQQYPILREVFLHINQNLESTLHLSELTGKCNISQAYLSKLFRQCFQLSVTDYIHQRKILAAKASLAVPGTSLTDIAFRYGYTDYSHFSKIFKKYEGISPNEYRLSAVES